MRVMDPEFLHKQVEGKIIELAIFVKIFHEFPSSVIFLEDGIMFPVKFQDMHAKLIAQAFIKSGSTLYPMLIDPKFVVAVKHELIRAISLACISWNSTGNMIP